MSRKHFQALANAISTIHDVKERKRIARLIADVCSSQNSRFDYSIFYDACDVEF